MPVVDAQARSQAQNSEAECPAESGGESDVDRAGYARRDTCKKNPPGIAGFLVSPVKNCQGLVSSATMPPVMWSSKPPRRRQYGSNAAEL